MSDEPVGPPPLPDRASYTQEQAAQLQELAGDRPLPLAKRVAVVCRRIRSKQLELIRLEAMEDRGHQIDAVGVGRLVRSMARCWLVYLPEIPRPAEPAAPEVSAALSWTNVLLASLPRPEKKAVPTPLRDEMLPDLLSAADLAPHVGMTVNAVQKFLERCREKYPDCYMKTDSPRRNEPKYPYRTKDVLPLLRREVADG